MAVQLLCLVCLVFCGWVLLLKAEIQELREQNARLRESMARNLARVGLEVERVKLPHGGKSP